MPLYLLPSLLLYILMVGYTPGPANLYALSCSLKYGRKSALRMWYGELCGFLIAVTLVSIATHLVGTVMGEYVEWLKYVGAAYILWLAYNIYKSKGLAENEAHTCSFTSGMIVQLTNAKMLLFDLTIFSMFVLPYSNSLIDLLFVGYILTLAGPTANLEGSDDMPAHAKSTLCGVSISIPITKGRLNLGTWQGIYLCEFRDYGGESRIVATIIGE